MLMPIQEGFNPKSYRQTLRSQPERANRHADRLTSLLIKLMPGNVPVTGLKDDGATFSK